MKYIIELTETQQKTLFYILAILSGLEWVKKGGMEQANVTLQIAPSEKKALGKIFEKLSKKNTSFFSLADLIPPGKKAGDVVE
jgi:hypothetical protein